MNLSTPGSKWIVSDHMGHEFSAVVDGIIFRWATAEVDGDGQNGKTFIQSCQYLTATKAILGHKDYMTRFYLS